MDITAKKVSVEDMKSYYSKHYAYEPTKQRVGRWAKTAGFKLAKQMIHGKTIYFYIKDEDYGL